MVRVFIGFDSRQPIAYHVLCSSILRHASVPVAITPLLIDTLPIERTGLTDFTFARYLVPWLCDYEGVGIFMDSDMLVTGDVAELAPGPGVSVVKHDEEHRYEDTSLMVFNSAGCRDLTPEYIETGNPQSLEWANPVGELEADWNFLVGYDPPTGARIPKLLHYTQGIPEYKECRSCDYADHWFAEKDLMLSSVSWLEIMYRSVHAESVLKRLTI